jgi:signal transduction histidine kinase
LVTGTVSEEFAANCIKQGADDYVLKSNLTRLPQAIASAIQQRSFQSEKLKSELTLRLKNEELTKINQELDSFVYSVSHNLRAPLMSVLGLLNLANKDHHDRDPVYNHYFKMMESSVKRLDETLKEIIEYSRNARVETVLKNIEFEKIIHDCIEKLHYLEGFDKTRISVFINGEDNTFRSDSYRLSVILSNLLSNSIKYRDTNKVNSFINIKVDSKPSGVTLVVEDNGIGIPEDQQANVFRMFYRATEKSEGAGLGLYIVNEVVEKLQASIQITSAFGKGTKFTITFPQISETSECNQTIPHQNE